MRRRPFFAFLLLSFFASCTSLSAEDKTVESLADGGRITTSNSVGTVEVRAKSLGPGTCGVNFTADGGNSVGLTAPPLVFGNWAVLANHLNSTTYTINYTVTCDTGVVAEVRYYKKL